MEKIKDGILCDRKDDNENDRQVLLTLVYKEPEGANQLRGMKQSLQQTMTNTNIVTIYKRKKTFYKV